MRAYRFKGAWDGRERLSVAPKADLRSLGGYCLLDRLESLEALARGSWFEFVRIVRRLSDKGLHLPEYIGGAWIGVSRVDGRAA